MGRSIKQNFIYSASYQILNIAVPLITTPILSRTIGAQGNGIFSYTQSIANYFVLFAQLGITNYGVREIAKCGSDRYLRSRVFADLFAMNLFWGCLIVAAYLGYCFSFGFSYMPISLIWLCWVGGSVFDVTWLLNGCEEFKVPMIRNACTRLAGMMAIVLFVRTDADVWIYVSAIAIPFLLNALLIWPFVPSYVDFCAPSFDGAISHLVPNIILFIPVVAVSLYTLLDKVMLGALGGMTQAGLYDYAEKISKMPLAVVTALGAVVLPRMTEELASGRHAEAKSLVSTTMWFMECVSIALCFGIIAVAKEFTLFFFGNGYGECAPLMSILSIIIPLISATNVIGVQFLVPSGRDRQYTISVICGAIVNIAINILFIAKFGAVAAAIATVLAELTVLALQIYMVHDELDIFHTFLSVIPFVVFGVAMFLVVRVASAVLGGGLPSAVCLTIEVLTGMAVYLFLAIGWCLVTRNKHFYRLFSKWFIVR